MKEDFCGWFGTASLREELNKINAAQSIHTVILMIDSPGGTVDGTQAFADAIKNSPKKTVAIIDGMAASAAYWIASSADEIIATSQTDIIGSIGTMISFYDRSEYYEEMGFVLREYYADDSKDKNKMMREAVKGNGKLLVKELLNPTNDIFLNAVRENRGKKLNEEETLTGKTFLAEKAKEMGLVDKISSLDDTVNKILQKNKTSDTMKFSLKATCVAILGFLGLKAEEGKDSVELTEEHINKIEAALPELATTKEKVTQLEGQLQEKDQKITALEGEKTQLTTKVTELNAEVTRLGALDAGKVTTPIATEDKHVDEGADKADAMSMDFQQDLMSKV